MSQRIRLPRAGARARWMAGMALSAAAALALGACRETDAKAADSARTAVEVGRENIAIATTSRLSSGPAISGTLTPRHEATVRAEVSGPVLQTYVEKGQPVRRGAPLARIDDTSIREGVLSARSAERSAKLALENARRDLERNSRLESAGAIATRDVESAQRALAAAEAAYADAQARLTAAEQQLGKTQVRAPFAGIVSDRPANAGDVVQPGTALVTIVDPSSMRLEASVPAEQISALKAGAPVRFTVNGYPGRTFTGRIDRINPTADSATRQVRIYVSIPNKGSSLVAGLFAQGRVAAEVRDALVAPIAAVDQRGVTPTVMRIKQGRVEKVPVELGIRDPETDRVEISAGVAQGDTLLLGVAQGITPGTPVRVVVTSDQPPAGR